MYPVTTLENTARINLESEPVNNPMIGPIQLDADPSLRALETALVGFAIHAHNTSVLPAADTFLPGALQDLVRWIHVLEEQDFPISFASLRYGLERQQSFRNDLMLALADAMHHGADVPTPLAHQYAREVRAAAARRRATQYTERAQQLLQAGEDAEALDLLGAAIGALGALGGGSHD